MTIVRVISPPSNMVKYASVDWIGPSQPFENYSMRRILRLVHQMNERARLNTYLNQAINGPYEEE